VDTPTIVDKLAQWLQSERCQEMHESYERTGDVALLADESTTANNTFLNYNNKNSLQGGTITVLNPSTFVRLAPADLEDTDKIPVVISEVVEEHKLPLPVVQTNRKRTMMTRSLSRQASEVASRVKEEEDDDDDSDYVPDSPPRQPAAKKSRRSVAGRKPNSGRSDDLQGLAPEERQKVVMRRQKNKEAAARCRQKRVDLTNKLQKEVNEHQVIKCKLEDEIKRLRMEQDNLRRLLESHKAYGCALQVPNNMYAPPPVQAIQPQPKPFAVAIKSAPVIVEAVNAPYIIPDAEAAEHQPLTKPHRPQTLLGLSCSKPAGVRASQIKEEDLETPSKIVASLFEQSGFTPTSIFGNVPSLNTPTCSVQQRSTEVMGELSTPNDGISLTAL